MKLTSQVSAQNTNCPPLLDQNQFESFVNHEVSKLQGNQQSGLLSSLFSSRKEIDNSGVIQALEKKISQEVEVAHQQLTQLTQEKQEELGKTLMNRVTFISDTIEQKMRNDTFKNTHIRQIELSKDVRKKLDEMRAAPQDPRLKLKQALSQIIQDTSDPDLEEYKQALNKVLENVERADRVNTAAASVHNAPSSEASLLDRVVATLSRSFPGSDSFKAIVKTGESIIESPYAPIAKAALDIGLETAELSFAQTAVIAFEIGYNLLFASKEETAATLLSHGFTLGLLKYFA